MFASYRDGEGDARVAMLGGIQSGFGVRFPGIDGSRAEFGVSHRLTEAFGEHRNSYGRIGTPGKPDFSIFAVYVALGFGDK
jgi:hypothetical protein